MKLLVVRDESSKILGHRYLNSQISFYVGLLQLAVCIWAMAQHVFSIAYYNKILFCDFVNGTEPVLLVGVDIIIFDIGLFHSLWGIDSCVAQHLDGGYGRCTWCICHITAFVICLPFAFVSRPRPYSLWPLLIQQSAYGVGLLILSLAALPRVLPTFTGDENSASVLSVSIYAAGASLNFFLLYIYWHWYWHVEAMWNSARKLHSDRSIPNANQRSRRVPFKHASIVDEVAPLQIQVHALPQQLQSSTSLSESRQKAHQSAVATPSEKLHKGSSTEEYRSYTYHQVQAAEGVTDGYRSQNSIDRGEDEKLLQNECDERGNYEPGRRTIHDNGYLPSELQLQKQAYRVKESSKQLQCGSSPLDSAHSLKSCRPSYRPAIKNTGFARRFGGSQRRPLVRQPAQHDLPPHHKTISPMSGLADEYAFCSPLIQ